MMKKSSTLAIATVLLLATSAVARAQGDAGTGADADCNRVFKAKAAADKNISSNQLARDLNLPVETVNTCLLRLRQAPRAATPPAGN